MSHHEKGGLDCQTHGQIITMSRQYIEFDDEGQIQFEVYWSGDLGWVKQHSYLARDCCQDS